MCDEKRFSIINFLVVAVLVCNIDQYEFVTGYHNGDVRCVEREKAALLELKKGLIDDYDRLSSWGSEDRKRECCKWEGVECSNTTGHVTGLYLYDLRGNLSSNLLELHHLEVLDLTNNDFGRNTIPEVIFSMVQLQHLYLIESNFSGIVPHQIGNLTNLQTLDLSWNDFGGSKIPESICSMVQLQHLYLIESNFSGIVPHQIGNLTNLKKLVLRNNSLLIDNIIWLDSRLPLLLNLDLSYVKIHDPNCLQYALNLPSLRELSLNNCGLTDSIKPSPDVFVNLSSSTSSLRLFDLSENELTSSTTIDLLLNNRTGPRLENLDVSFNLLKVTIAESKLDNLLNLKGLDLSFNSLILRVSHNWTPPFKLDYIFLRGCNMGPHFPLWLRTQNNVHSLDLSSSGLTGEVPKWFWNLSPWLDNLNISHNHLSGIVPDFPTEYFDTIDLSSNEFSGPIPLFPPGTSVLQLSQNMFSGSVSSICQLYDPYMIDLSNNLLAGELPNCWENMTGLYVLNLANNSLSGEIPHSLGSIFNLTILQLGNNNLSGELPSTLKNCKDLQMIDVRDNMLAGNIPTWIGAYEYMAYLIFSNNRFEGSIPPHICNLSHTQVLDLSGNHLSGRIPPCFNSFSPLVQMNNTVSRAAVRLKFMTNLHFIPHEYVESAIVSWKGQEFEYRRNLAFLKLIDLSSNRLVGDIPKSFSSLRGLRSLNLSRNSLTGSINPDIGQMTMLETLDLSSNHLSGAIPIGMAQLYFLAVLNLSNNNLSGKIPIGHQLQTFNASSYAGNIGLCGSPLPLCPGDSPHPSANNKARDIDDEKDDDGILSSSFFMDIVISIAFGFILGFWGVVGSLIVKKSWRRSFFNFWGAVGDWLYVTANIFWAKFRRS